MKKVVSATLAGALAVGMVPAMALADDAVELQAAADVDLVQAGKIIAHKGGVAPAMEIVAGDADAFDAIKPIAVAEDGAGTGEYNAVSYQWIKYDPTSTATADSGNYTVNGKKFVKDGAWSAVNAAMPTAPGNYVMIAQVLAVDVNENGVADSGDTVVDCYNGFAFTVVPAAMKGELKIYEVGDAYDYSDTTFTYDGQFFEFGVDLNITLNGKPLAYGSEYVVTKIYKASGEAAANPNKVRSAGTYTAEVSFDGVVKLMPFTIEKLDLGQADIKLVSDVIEKGEKPQIASINGDAWPTPGVAISSYGCLIDSAALVADTYELTLSATADADGNIVASTAKLPYTVVGNALTKAELKLSYGAAEADDNADFEVTVERDKADAVEFDVSKLVVKAGAKTFKAGEYDLVVTKKNALGGWDVVDASDITNAATFGEYKVKAVLKAEALDYLYGGETYAMDVKVSNGTIQNADVAFAYKGDNVTTDEYNDGGAIMYSGANFMDDLAVAVKANGVAVPASDYTVVVSKQVAGQWVVVTDGIVNVGDYKVEVKSSKYNVLENAIYVEIKQAPLVAIIGDQIDNQDVNNTPSDKTDDLYNGNEFIYTGNALNPIAFFGIPGTGVGYKDGLKVDAAGKPVMVDLAASGYKVTITGFTPEAPNAKPVLTKDLPTEFKAAGTYTFKIVDTDTATVFDNYDLADATPTITITAVKVFPDVTSDAWYADEVLAVAQNGWITGYDNGLFGPNDGMKRGDLALVLGRALGMDVNPLLNGSSNTIIKVVTGFEDVDGGVYYARAIKAISEAGIMTGYGDGTNFGPNELVTRQQLATILARVEESGLGDASILASALDAYVDADEVAGWAAEGVEWAVENGIMGVDTAFLNPTDTVTRAEVAAMLVRYDAVVGGLKPFVVAVA